MQRKNEIFEMAEEMGIEIVNARTDRDSSMLVAIHLLNPDMQALEDSVFEAETNGYNFIVIYSKQTWPFNTNKEKVESIQKLLA